jgi:hypothetical protein
MNAEAKTITDNPANNGQIRILIAGPGSIFPRRRRTPQMRRNNIDKTIDKPQRTDTANCPYTNNADVGFSTEVPE